jgi:putative ABC transport system substrate-binding protein
MKRRNLIIAAGTALAAPGVMRAQATRHAYRIALLDDSSKGSRSELWAVFRKRLGELGYAEGRNLVIDERYAQAVPERLPALAAELVAANPDVIVSPGTLPSRAALRATSSIPIVFISVGDPVSAGLVASLARPGGNATGLSSLATDIALKRLELLRELAPSATRIGYVADATNPANMIAFSRLEEDARKRKISMTLLDGLGDAALERSFAAVRQNGVQALLVGATGTLLDYRARIVQFAARERVPALYGFEEFVIDGGLASYSPDRKAIFTRGAEYVHRVLRGTRPADIPVERPTKIRFLLNLKAARAIGLKISDAVRLRADEVIE